MFQMKERDKTPEELGEVKIDNLPNKEVKVMIVNMIKELKRRWINTEVKKTWKI